MKLIQLPKKHNDEDWSMRFVDDSEYDQLFDEDVRVLKPDGSPLLVLLKGALTKENTALAWSVLKSYRVKTMNRGMAAGRESENKTRNAGYVSSTLESPKGWEVCSGIVGYFERTVRMPYCRACAWNLKNPEKFEKILPMVREVDGLFRKHIPDRYKIQQDIVSRTSKDFVIPGTVFTTLTVNKTFRTACHKDAGDLPEGFSCLSVIRRGLYSGGNLVFPNYRVAVKLDTLDVILFDPHEFHGNTQIVPLSKDAERCSIVYYFREKMVQCGSAADELKRAKNRKPGDNIWDT